MRSYLRGGTVSSCQRRLDGVFLSGSVMCALCGLAAEVCKAPCAPATRARRFCAAGARPISGRRTRFEELSAATVVKFGATVITSQRVIINDGRSGAQSGRAFQGAVFKIDLIRDTLASFKPAFRMRPLARKFSLEASCSFKAADDAGSRTHSAGRREDESSSEMRS